MRKIKGSSSYLKNQVRKNLAKAGLSAIVFAAISALLIFRILSTLKVGILEMAGLAFLVVPLGAFYFYLRKYHIYNGGLSRRKTSCQTSNSHIKRRLLSPKRLVPTGWRRRHRPHRFGTQRCFCFRN